MSSTIFNLVLLVHVLAGLSVIGLVLVQHGKGADMGAAFGSGASGSLFGASGSANFLSRTTAVLATVFFITSLSLSYLAAKRPMEPASVMERERPAVVAPAEPDSSPAPAEPSPETVPAETAPAETPAPAGQGSAADAIPE
ncbi:MAG: preprotein translocase subunit SecG [Azoarcus sp.]|jgi:preprotein translocase subunit SecG|nr:preprotein translocase subunit SecG [Azoarcus sp.]